MSAQQPSALSAWQFQGPDGARLRLRKDQAQEIEGTVEVVYADSWDDLADVAHALALALHPFSGTDCSCDGEEPECQWCAAASALRRYENG